eukprot:g17747.t1
METKDIQPNAVTPSCPELPRCSFDPTCSCSGGLVKREEQTSTGSVCYTCGKTPSKKPLKKHAHGSTSGVCPSDDTGGTCRIFLCSRTRGPTIAKSTPEGPANSCGVGTGEALPTASMGNVNVEKAIVRRMGHVNQSGLGSGGAALGFVGPSGEGRPGSGTKPGHWAAVGSVASWHLAERKPKSRQLLV